MEDSRQGSWPDFDLARTFLSALLHAEPEINAENRVQIAPCTPRALQAPARCDEPMPVHAGRTASLAPIHRLPARARRGEKNAPRGRVLRAADQRSALRQQA